MVYRQQINKDSLDCALKTGNEKLIELILSFGAFPSQHSLYYALQTKNPNILHTIVKLNNLPNKPDSIKKLDYYDCVILCHFGASSHVARFIRMLKNLST